MNSRSLLSKRWLVPLLALLAVLLTRPWTVRPITPNDDTSIAMTPGDKAVTIWNERLRNAEYKTFALGEEYGDGPALVAGTGSILSVVRTSRAGQALLDVSPEDGIADIAIQIGPVIRGTALRDALGYAFSDFESQMDYARFADALNSLVLREVPVLEDPDQLSGRTVTFAGALAGNKKSPPELVPTRIEVMP